MTPTIITKDLQDHIGGIGMMHRFWIALALALALALSACAEETVPAGGAEDALTIEDPGFDGIEPVIDDAGGLLSGDLALNAADGLLSGDLALDAETVGALPGADNGAEANRFTNIRTWFDFVNKDLPDASNGDTLAFTTGVFVGTESAHIDKSITMLLQNDVLFLGEYTATPLICIYSDVDVLLTGYGGHFLAGRNPAMWVLHGGRFTMDGYCTTISEFNYGVRNDGVFTMKGGSLFKNKCGVENTDVFIIDGTSYECTITDNEQGVVAPLTSHNNSTAVTVSGDVSIRDNKECDVLLQKGQVVALGGPLLKRSSIGITLSEDNQPGPDSPVVVTRGLKGNGTADNFFVWGDYETGINADGELEVRKKGPTAPASPDATLLAKLTACGNHALKLNWTEVEGAQGYDVYFGPCGSDSLKKKATVTDGRSCKLTGLKRGKTYKAFVRAWKKSGGEKRIIGKASPTVYAIAGGYSDTRCNPKSVTLNRQSLALKAGKSVRIRARVKGVKSGRKLLHRCSPVRWYSSNNNVAKVNGDGKVTGVAKGSCTVYAVANNGVRSSVKVKVK